LKDPSSKATHCTLVKIKLEQNNTAKAKEYAIELEKYPAYKEYAKKALENIGSGS